ncbi:MAG: hypothetical protein PHN84_13230 [Desulfuromonadaceae bacterium]|nr:hypothetical protein [Desulfuromonadaceae bacterium]MDD2855500.1 hypothetical protein [Desulfuromonadaceae bacterium]
MINVIASNHTWHKDFVKSLSEITAGEFILITNKDELTFELLNKLQPRYIFFPHWSYIIPKEIYENFECIIFHMTDVPYGRGGTPLQNLIARGIYETKITALRCEAELDAGQVYMKYPLSLYGTAEEIYIRAGRIIETMIVEMVSNKPASTPQEGEVVCFTRRKPQESDISKLKELEQAFDYIRMLDAEGYPHAFLETDNLRFEFQRPSLKQGKIIADVVITKKG